jgi:hypothetical protein
VVADPVGRATGTAGGDGVHQVDPAVAVEHDCYTGAGIDRRDEHRSFGPALTGQAGGDGGAPPHHLGAIRHGICFERHRTHAAAHVGRVRSGGDDAAHLLQMVGDRPCGNASAVGLGLTSSSLGCRGEDGVEESGRGRSGDLGRGRGTGRRPDDEIGLGHVQPGFHQAGDDADQPRIAGRSATAEDQRSLTLDGRPPCGVGVWPIGGPRPVGGRRRGDAQR